MSDSQKTNLTLRRGIVGCEYPALIEEQLKAAKSLIADTKKANGEVLVICEKSLYKEELEALSSKAGFHYLNHKVPA